MYFGFEVEPPEDSKEDPQTAANSWNVWDSLKEATQLVTRYKTLLTKGLV